MIVRNSANIAGLLLIVGGITSALSRWYLVWIAQRLGGPEILGVYGMLFAIATPLFVATQLGLRILFLSKSRAFPWKSYLILRVIGLIAGSSILLPLVLLNPLVPVVLGLAVLSIKVFDGISDLYLAKVQYDGQVVTIAVISLGSSILTFIFATLGALATQSFYFAVVGAAFASLLSAFWSISIARRVSYVEDSNESGLVDILRSSFSVTAADLLASMLLYLPVLYLSFSGDLRAVGVFTGVAYALTAADLVGSSLAKVLITPLRRIFKMEGNMATINRSNVIAFRALVAGVPVAIAFVLVGNLLFEWIYGPEFRLSAIVLILFAFAGICIVVSHLQSVCLNVLNHYNRVAISFGVACGLAFVTGLVLNFFGLDALTVGAAMAAIGSVGRAVTMFLGVRKEIQDNKFAEN